MARGRINNWEGAPTVSGIEIEPPDEHYISADLGKRRLAKFA